MIFDQDAYHKESAKHQFIGRIVLTEQVLKSFGEYPPKKFDCIVYEGGDWKRQLGFHPMLANESLLTGDYDCCGMLGVLVNAGIDSFMVDIYGTAAEDEGEYKDGKYREPITYTRRRSGNPPLMRVEYSGVKWLEGVLHNSDSICAGRVRFTFESRREVKQDENPFYSKARAW